MTQSGVVLGSAAYLSPEQVEGKPAQPASDIYALGVVLFEMLTGRLPFEADTPVAMAMKHVQDEPVAPDTLNPAIDAGAADIVLRALAKDPTARYPSAAAFGAALQEQIQAPAGQRTAYRPLGAETTAINRRHVPVGSRRPLPILLGLGGLAAAVVLALIFTAGLRSGHPHRVAGTRASGSTHRVTNTRPAPTARPAAHTSALPASAPSQPTAAPKVAAPAPTRPPATAPAPTSPPATAPVPTSPPAAAPPSAPVGVAGALAAVQSAVASGVASGQVQPKVATDLYNSLDALQAQLQKGKAKDIEHKVADMQHKVDGHIHDGTITPAAAQRIDAALANLQMATAGDINLKP
jgi:hypothetical protein